MKAVLGLEDGTVISGTGFGIEGRKTGELIVNLASTGYMEALSDPGVSGQILMFGSPLIGNYGALASQLQSDKIQANAAVVHELCNYPKHQPPMRDYFEEQGLVGIEGVDTRMLTIKLREKGTMRAAVITGSEDGAEAVALARSAPVQESLDLIPGVTCKEPYHIEGKGKKIAVLDLGVKKAVLQSLSKRGADLYIYPYGTPADQIMKNKPAALFVTNGPGYPLMATKAIDTVKELIGRIPVQGICMGSEVIAAALGAEFDKLKLGHRGASQPVRFSDGTVAVTFQSHGYVIREGTLPEGCQVTCVNANDGTIEGFENPDLGISCVQFHPEHDAIHDNVEKPIFDMMYRGIPDA